MLLARGVNEPVPEEIASMRASIGLDGSPVTRFVTWGGRVVRGNFGSSWVSGRSVADELSVRLGPTALLTAFALLFALVIATTFAMAAAAFPNRWPDTMVRFYATIFASVPGFLVGISILQFLVVGLGWGKVIGDGSWKSALWPALALAAPLSATWARFLRANLLLSLAGPSVDVAFARGASRWRILVVHALPNAIVPFLSLAGVGVSALIGGAPIFETIFTWPGIGKYAVDAVGGRDLPVIQGFALFAVVSFVSVSLLFDVVASWLDPRLRGRSAIRRLVPATTLIDGPGHAG